MEVKELDKAARKNGGFLVFAESRKGWEPMSAFLRRGERGMIEVELHDQEHALGFAARKRDLLRIGLRVLFSR